MRIHDDDKVLESFIFNINNKILNEKNENISDLEETFRNCIYSLENRCKLKKAPKDSRFKILLHTESYSEYASESRNLVSLELSKKVSVII